MRRCLSNRFLSTTCTAASPNVGVVFRYDLAAGGLGPIAAAPMYGRISLSPSGSVFVTDMGDGRFDPRYIQLSTWNFGLDKLRRASVGPPGSRKGLWP